MYREAYDELAEAAQRVRQAARLDRLIQRLSDELARADSRAQTLEKRLRSEVRDVERLDGMTLTALLGRVAGKLEAWRDKEVAEATQARADYEAARAEVEQLAEHRADIQTQRGQLGDAASDYARAFQDKTRAILERGDDAAQRLSELSREVADSRSLLREIDEATTAGSIALRSVTKAGAGIPAENTSTTLVPVGNVTIPIVSESELSAAVESGLRDAQRWTARFERELLDLEPWTGDSLLPGVRLLRSYAEDLSRPSVQGAALERTRAAVESTQTRLDELLAWLAKARRAAAQRHRRAEASYVEQVTRG